MTRQDIRGRRSGRRLPVHVDVLPGPRPPDRVRVLRTYMCLRVLTRDRGVLMAGFIFSRLLGVVAHFLGSEIFF